MNKVVQSSLNMSGQKRDRDDNNNNNENSNGGESKGGLGMTGNSGEGEITRRPRGRPAGSRRTNLSHQSS
ncbi:hypothetical protein HAX54_020751 [Datura stramonium]|uniref:Uncharacterized protein n=1 Tax=Datura stramonium TaxID=4076 RepID=A0ABS8RJI3_DATST|nr:hypothetical protein [Datura stramonium]